MTYEPYLTKHEAEQVAKAAAREVLNDFLDQAEMTLHGEPDYVVLRRLSAFSRKLGLAGDKLLQIILQSIGVGIVFVFGIGLSGWLSGLN